MVGNHLLAFGRKGSSEEINRCSDPGLGKAAGLSDIGDSEKCDLFLFQGAGYGLQPVAVGTCLDDRHDPLTTQLACNRQVVSDAREINLGP